MNLDTYEYVDTKMFNFYPWSLPTSRTDRRKTCLSSIQAPVVDPFVGPNVTGKGLSALFFHKILGHRVEGTVEKMKPRGKH